MEHYETLSGFPSPRPDFSGYADGNLYNRQNTNLEANIDAEDARIRSKLAGMRKELESKAFRLWVNDTQGRTPAEIYRDLQLSAIMDLRSRS